MIPQTFAEMYGFNQPVMQQSDESKKELNMEWVQEIVPVFGSFVESVDRPAQLRILCDDISPKINATGVTMDGLDFFKDVMCASLRSLLPSVWDIKHEVAWKWFWEKLSRNFTLKADFGVSCVQSSWSKIAKEQPAPPPDTHPSAQVPVTFARMME